MCTADHRAPASTFARALRAETAGAFLLQNEHCESADSQVEFTVWNYGTRTTPEKEYWFVADPLPREKMGNKRKQRLCGGSGGWPAEEEGRVEKGKERRPTPLDSFEQKRDATPPLLTAPLPRGQVWAHGHGQIPS